MANGNSYPVAVGQTLPWKTRNFPESVYNLDPGDNLTVLMQTLLGNSGAGQLSIVQTSARNTERYPIFSDLEQIFGQLLGSPRLPYEIYSHQSNPFTDQLSISQWQDVQSKDSTYRERLLAIVSAILKGGTVMGVQDVVEAMTYSPVQLIEMFTSASGAAVSNGWSRTGVGSSEVIAIANVPSGINPSNITHQSIVQVAESVLPTSVVLTIPSGNINNFNPVSYTNISGSSEYFFMDRNSTASVLNIPSYVINNPDYTVTSRYWLQSNTAVEAPYFAFLLSQESSIDLTSNISVVNITPITGQGVSLTSTSSSSPLSNETLSVTSTIFGAE